jgi:large subunit ribosomal protein L29
MRAKELREKTDGELAELERDLTRDLWKTRLKNFTNQLDNTAKIRSARRDLARVKTLLTERAHKSAAQ